jgi:hypothetical protein
MGILFNGLSLASSARSIRTSDFGGHFFHQL